MPWCVPFPQWHTERERERGLKEKNRQFSVGSNFFPLQLFFASKRSIYSWAAMKNFKRGVEMIPLRRRSFLWENKKMLQECSYITHLTSIHDCWYYQDHGYGHCQNLVILFHCCGFVWSFTSFPSFASFASINSIITFHCRRVPAIEHLKKKDLCRMFVNIGWSMVKTFHEQSRNIWLINHQKMNRLCRFSMNLVDKEHSTELKYRIGVRQCSIYF